MRYAVSSFRLVSLKRNEAYSEPISEKLRSYFLCSAGSIWKWIFFSNFFLQTKENFWRSQKRDYMTLINHVNLVMLFRLFFDILYPQRILKIQLSPAVWRNFSIPILDSGIWNSDCSSIEWVPRGGFNLWLISFRLK